MKKIKGENYIKSMDLTSKTELEQIQEMTKTLEEKDNENKKIIEEIEKNIRRKEISFNLNNYVVMANNMVLHSASNLSLNELKLLRLIIAQSTKEDKELFEFELSAKDLSKFLGIKNKDIYKRLDTMTTHLMQEVIRIGDDSKKEWRKFHWVDICQYENGKIYIKISEQLKPYLINLEKCFSRYKLEEIIRLKSIYAIRIYEMLNGYMNDNNLPHANIATEISVSIDELRRATDTETKFERYSSFKTKVIDTALDEINEKSKYHITATPYKDGHAIKGFDFMIESQAGYIHRINLQDNTTEEVQLSGQMNIYDYETSNNKFTITKG